MPTLVADTHAIVWHLLDPRVLPFDVEQAIEFGALPAIRDPMDRMVAAAARVTGSRLVTADVAVAGHGVETVWD